MMRKTLALLCAITVTFSMTACGKSNDSNGKKNEQETTEATQAVTEATEETTEEPTEEPTEEATEEEKDAPASSGVLDTTFDAEDISFLVSSEWNDMDNDYGYYWYQEDAGMMYLNIQEIPFTEMDDDTLTTLLDSFYTGATSTSDENTFSEMEYTEIADQKAIVFDMEVENYTVQIYAVVYTDHVYSFGFSTAISGETSELSAYIEEILDSVEFSENSDDDEEESSSEDESSEESSEDSDDSSTAGGKEEALEEALSYLKYSAFSYDGLIGQLEYEGYSNADAVYAVDNCGADWMEQALLCAEEYLEYSAFSYDGLIGQLEYEGFTAEQAKHGADKCGADWMEQAELCAKDYLEYSEFTREELIDQLLYEEFTQEQAEHGVDAAGLK